MVYPCLIGVEEGVRKSRSNMLFGKLSCPRKFFVSGWVTALRTDDTETVRHENVTYRSREPSLSSALLKVSAPYCLVVSSAAPLPAGSSPDLLCSSGALDSPSCFGIALESTPSVSLRL